MIYSPDTCQLKEQNNDTSKENNQGTSSSHYINAKISVGHCSQFKYMHPQELLPLQHTLEAKYTFKLYTIKHGAKVHHYHARNSRFSDNICLTVITEKGRSVTFCRINMHSQNGIVEMSSRDLQEKSRKSP